VLGYAEYACKAMRLFSPTRADWPSVQALPPVLKAYALVTVAKVFGAPVESIPVGVWFTKGISPPHLQPPHFSKSLGEKAFGEWWAKVHASWGASTLAVICALEVEARTTWSARTAWRMRWMATRRQSLKGLGCLSEVLAVTFGKFDGKSADYAPNFLLFPSRGVGNLRYKMVSHASVEGGHDMCESIRIM